MTKSSLLLNGRMNVENACDDCSYGRERLYINMIWIVAMGGSAYI